MPIIAITPGLGTRYEEIALGIARRLSLKSTDWIISETVAPQLGIPVQIVAEILTGERSAPGLVSVDARQLGACVRKAVVGLAAQGDALITCVGGANLLASVSHVVCVHVDAPERAKAGHLIERKRASDHAAALRQISRSEAILTANIESMFALTTAIADEIFDVAMDTAWLSPQDWIEELVELTQDQEFVETSASRDQLERLTREAAAQVLAYGTGHPAGGAASAGGYQDSRRQAQTLGASPRSYCW